MTFQYLLDKIALLSLCVVFTLGFSMPAQAQFSKIMHDTYPVDGIDAVELKVTGPVQLEPWQGSMLMVETSVQLYNASEGILRHFMDKKRYKINSQLDGSTLILESEMKEREPIQRKGFKVEEDVLVKVFVPAQFEIAGENRLERKVVDR